MLYNFDFEKPGVDWKEVSEFRLKRLKQSMGAHNMDALLTMRLDNVRYMTRFRGLTLSVFFTMRYAGILTAESQPYLLVASGDFARAKKEMPWQRDRVKPLPMDVGIAGGTFAEAFNELNFKGGTVGVDIMPISLFKSLEKQFPKFHFVDGGVAFADAKSVKHPGEIEALRQSSIVAELGMDAFLKATEEGETEIEISALADYRMRSAGAEDAFALIMSGEHAVELNRFPTMKRIRRGELVLADIGCTYLGYNSDFARTVICGDPTPEQKRVYQAVYHALRAAIQACKPGVPSASIDKASRDILRQQGYEKYWYFGVTGHGVGISIQEPPTIGENVAAGEREVLLEVGNVFSIEPSVHLPGVGGVRLEDTVVVTDKGAEVLTHTQFDERLLG
jgi:Xaa-Pro aminopeptidase